MPIRITISEATAEQIVDRLVMSRLNRDSAYRNAENAEDQAEREAAITAEAWAEVEARYNIA